MAALQDKTLSDDSPSSSFKKHILGPALIDGLSWTTAESVRSSLWSSKVDAEVWTLFTTGNGRQMWVKIHHNNYKQLLYQLRACNAHIQKARTLGGFCMRLCALDSQNNGAQHVDTILEIIQV